MKFGLVKCGCFSPKIKVCDVEFNAQSIINDINKAKTLGVELVVFPEMCLTGYTLGDLVFSDVLLSGATRALEKIVSIVPEKMLVFLGMPLKKDGIIYNVAVGISGGKIVGVIPKTNLSSFQERYFAPARKGVENLDVCGQTVPFGTDIIFSNGNSNLKIAVEIGEDLFAINSPSNRHAENGATVIVNLSANAQIIGKSEGIINAVNAQSKKLCSAYMYSEAGDGESTTDSVFSGQAVISELGKTLAQKPAFLREIAITDIDVDLIAFRRSKWFKNISAENYVNVNVDILTDNEKIDRFINNSPFVPTCEKQRKARAEEVLNIQAEGLKKRIEHTNSGSVVIGLSGGLDSTLAILVAVKAMGLANRSIKDVIAVTMPCFGTTSRTYDNTIKLAKALGVTLKKIDITKSVLRHLKDIKHNGSLDVTYENAQARERTQVLMDVANQTGGLVVGTGDMSELALGWATYNGDHMSMYGVNCSIPKTLVRHIVSYVAENSKGKLKAVLFDILDTPVSPELLPPKSGDISQKTEDIVGPYELHDFFLYNFIRNGYSPIKIYQIAKRAFYSEYDNQTILKWLKTFVRRFFNQQFKRSCVPDGVKVGSLSLSPRGEWSMPSDAVSTLWLKELDGLED